MAGAANDVADTAAAATPPTTSPTTLSTTPSTKLSRRLHGEERARERGPMDAFDRARRRVLAGERVDMQALAADLGVDRATLFRWVGNREQLLVEVIWSTAEPTWRDAVAQAAGTGAARVADAVDRFVRDVIAAEFFAVYLRREPERALRLLTTKAGAFQQRLVTRFERLLTEEAARLRLSLPVRDFAYLMVRVVESFVYADLIINETPDAAKAAAAIGALLGIDPARPLQAASPESR